MCDASWALRRYEEIRPRLPQATHPKAPAMAANLAEIADQFEVFVLDAFGVLNVGEEPIPGVSERIGSLQAAGKLVFVLTNSASFDAARTLAKYHRLGFGFLPDQVITSRDIAAEYLADCEQSMSWGIIAADEPQNDLSVARLVRVDGDVAAANHVDGIVFLSSANWDFEHQARLVKSLAAWPRRVIVTNPDLVAPREQMLSLEPGFYAHNIQDETGIAPVFFGKPYANAFEAVRKRMGEVSIPPHRIAMVGDSLHTDILGGAAAGWRTVLVTDYGLLRDRDVVGDIEGCGIVPDFIVPKP